MPSEPELRQRVPQPRTMLRTDASPNAPWARWANWIVGVAAGVFVTIALGGYFYQRGQLADIAAEHLRLMVTGPARLCPGMPGTYVVRTTTVTGRPVPAQIAFSLLGPAGEQLAGHTETADEHGLVEIAVPAEATSVPEVRMEVTAVHLAKTERATAQIGVEPRGSLTLLTLSKPSYRPGETIRFRSLTVSRVGLAADRELPIRFEIRAGDGTLVPGSGREGTTVQGVGCGEVAAPAGLSGGRYVLIARSPDGRFPEARRDFVVRAEAPTPSKAGAPPHDRRPPAEKPGTIQVSFFPEGGDLVAGLENRVYFSAREGAGKPVRLSGRVVDSHGRVAAAAETTYEGMGSFQILPQATEPYRLKIDRPAAAPQEARLPPVVANHGVVLMVGLGVVEAGRPLEFNVRATAAGLPLVAVASCRGIQVGQATFVTGAGANTVSIPPGDDVAGVLRLDVYDYRLNPPRLLARRLIFRRPSRELRVQIAPASPSYRPGDRGELTIQVRDERGKPLPAALSIAVVDEAHWLAANASRESAAAQLLLSDGPWGPHAAGDADFCLSKDPKAPVALDLLLGTWARPAANGRGGEKAGPAATGKIDGLPPLVLDNLGQLQQQYLESLASYQAGRTRVLNMLTALSFFGGIGLVVFVAMLSLLNIPCGLRLWVPSLGVAAACVVIGAILMDPGRLKPNRGGAVPFASFEAPPGDEGSVQAAAASGGKSGKFAPFDVSGYEFRRDGKNALGGKFASDTLLWLPLKRADGQGQASVRVELPDVPGAYRVLIDAHAEFGRLGSGVTPLRCQKRTSP